MLNIVIFGPPGAGKGTQSDKLINKYNLYHISTGDLFRWHTANDTPLGKRVKEIMDSGQLVSDDITISMLREEVEKNPQASGFLFDGFPRTVAQAEALDTLMKSLNTEIHSVIELEVTEAEVRKRIAKRRESENRVDDADDKLERRIQEYFNKTVHVLPYYKNQQRLNSLNGIGDINEISQSIAKVLDGIHA